MVFKGVSFLGTDFKHDYPFSSFILLYTFRVSGEEAVAYGRFTP